jgi:cellobiose phosphorylase
MSYGAKTKYGHFSGSGKEYIVTRPDTPTPWMNFLFNGVYHAIVSQTGGGFSYYKDPKFNRILRYDHISTDRPGRYIFIHDHESRKYWSVNWQPIKRKYTSFECHHGLGYTSIKSETDKILSRITYLVSKNDPVEIYIVRIKNHGLKKRELSVFPYVDLVSGDAALEEVYHNIMMLYNRAEFNPAGNYILAYKMPFPHRMVETYTFFHSSQKADGFDTNRERFYGRYASSIHPEVIVKGKAKNTIASGEDMVGVFQHKISLKPGEEKTFVCVLGFVEKKNEIYSK